MGSNKETWQGNSVKRRNSAFFLFVFLGMLTAFGPFVTDMYLPSLPAMAEYFSAGASMVQLGLTFSMLGLAAGQILFGPLSDKYGRRKPLLWAMILFLLSTIGCIFAPTIEIFVFLRLIQGIAGAGGIVISRSVAADKFKGRNLAKALAVVGSINGIAPVAAPVIGGTALRFTSWQGVFWILFILGLILLGACLHFNESLSRPKRSKQKISKTLSLFKPLFANKKYLYYVLQMSFALNSLAIVGGSGFSVRFKSQEHCVSVSCRGMMICSVLLALALGFNAPLAVFEGLLLVLLFMLGLTFTAAVALAMGCAGSQAGAASALLGAVGFLFGSIVSPIVGLGDIMISSGIVFVVCAAGSSFFAVLARRASREASFKSQK